MKITDQNVLKILKKVRCIDLEEMLEDYPEDERDGRTDLEMLMNELNWFLECLEDPDCSFHEALLEAREVLQKTKYGKVMPLDPYNLKPIYNKHAVDYAKETVNEYNRLKRLQIKLNK